MTTPVSLMTQVDTTIDALQTAIRDYNPQRIETEFLTLCDLGEKILEISTPDTPLPQEAPPASERDKRLVWEFSGPVRKYTPWNLTMSARNLITSTRDTLVDIYRLSGRKQATAIFSATIYFEALGRTLDEIIRRLESQAAAN